MKMILTLLVAATIAVSTVSAATGSTSTGSTSTGSTSTGTTSSGTTSTGTTSTGTTSSGSTSTGVVESTYSISIGGGGPTRGWNATIKQFDLVPQCFPWAWLLDFYKGNIFMIYENQKACRAQRLIDFGM